MAYSDLLSKVEASAKAVVDDLGVSGVLCFTGVTDDTLQLPNVVVVAEATGKEVPPRTGNHVVTLRVDVQSQANDSSLDEHRERVATVFDAFADSDLPTTMSGHVDDFTVFDAYEPKHGRERFERTDGAAVMSDWITIDLLCCASDIS